MDKFTQVDRVRGRILEAMKSLVTLDNTLKEFAKDINEDAVEKFAQSLVSLDDASSELTAALELLKGSIGSLVGEMEGGDGSVVDAAETDNGYKL